jgi:hypothetical protein
MQTRTYRNILQDGGNLDAQHNEQHGVFAESERELASRSYHSVKGSGAAICQADIEHVLDI